jgi:serine/threonine protein kinase/WD40 repeat protein
VSASDSGEYGLLDRLAEEFAERYRRGERPALKEYLDRYPDLADELREVLPAMVRMEQAKEGPPEGPAAAPTLPPLERVGDYRIVREVGRGGMGVVYEAEQVSLGRRVALKVLPAQPAGDGRSLERFRREARAAAKLHHTNIVPVFEVGRDGDVRYYAMQFIAGQGLDQVVAELRQLRSSSRVGEGAAPPLSEAARSLLSGDLRGGRGSPGPGATVILAGPAPGPSTASGAAGASSTAVLPGPADLSGAESDRRHYFQSVARIGQQVAGALAYAHARGIVHRDVKPSNLLLDAAAVVWVTDFGLAKTEDEGLTQTGDIVGTLRYMAPERFRGQCDPRADVYSLGATLYELLVLQPAFASPDRLGLMLQVQTREPVRPRALDPRIPRDLETVVLTAMDKEPQRRYPSADELAADLGRFLSGEPIRARRVGELERLWKWGRRHPAVSLLLLTAVALLLAGTAVSTHFAVQAGRREQDATDAAGRAQGAEQRAVAQERRARLQAAELTFQAGLVQAQSEQVAGGMWTLLDAWRMAPADAHELRRVIRLNLAAWGRQLPVLRQAFEAGPAYLSLGDPGGKTLLIWNKGGGRRWDVATGRPVGPPFVPPEGALFLGVFGDATMGLLCQGKRYWVQDLLTGQKVGADFPPNIPDGSTGFLPFRRRWAAYLRHLSDQECVPVVFDLRGGTAAVVEDERVLPEEGAGLMGSRDGETVLAVFHRTGPGDGEREPRATFRRLPGGEVLARPAWPRLGADPRIRWDGRSLLSVKVSQLFTPGGEGSWESSLGGGARNEGSVQWWDAATGRPLGEPWRPRRQAWSAHLAGDGQALFEDGLDDHVRRYDLGLGLQRGGPIPTPGLSQNRSVVFPDGATVATAGGDVVRNAGEGVVRVWQTGECLPQHTSAANPRPAPGRLSRPDFDSVTYHPPTGRAVLVRGREYGRLTDWAGDRPLGQPLGQDLAHAAFSPDGKLLATASQAGGSSTRAFVHLWDAQTGQPRFPPLQSPRYTQGLAFSPDGRTLAVACVGLTLLVDAATGQVRRQLPLTSCARQVAFSPDGKTLAVAYQWGWAGVGAGLQLWEVGTGRPLGPFRPAPEGMNQPGRVLFADGGRTLVLLWTSWMTNEYRGQGPGGAAFQVHDGRTGEARGEAVLLGKVHQGLGVCRTDGKAVATSDQGGLVQQWDTATGRRLEPAMPHNDGVVALAYSPDGRWLAVACHDQSVRLWDTASGRPVGPPLVHRSPLLGLTFTPDSRVLATTTRTGFTRTWTLPEPVADDPDRVERWLQVASGVRREGGEMVLLSPEAWRSLAAGEHRVVDGDPLSDGRPWQERRAWEAEEDGDPRAALWYLDRVLAGHPDDWRLYARRGRLFTQAGEPERAAKEYALAEAKGGGEGLLDWYRHQAAVCGLLGQWPTALWYQDRLIAARPGDWRPYAARAETYGRLRKTAERTADLDRAIALGADAGVLVAAAEERGRRGDWRQAADLLGRALSGGAADLGLCYACALACLRAGDEAGYRKICEQLLQAVPGAKSPLSPEAANAVASLCAVGPDAFADWRRPLALADAAWAWVAKAEEQVKDAGEKKDLWKFRHAVRNTQGMVLFRAGRHQEAVDRLQESINAHGSGGDFHDWVFLALAHHALGHAAEARRWLEKALAETPAAQGQDFWAGLEVEVLRREARARVQGTPGPTPRKSL